MIIFNQVAKHLCEWEHRGCKERYLFYQGGTYAGKTMGSMVGLYAIAKKRDAEIKMWKKTSALPIPKELTIRVAGLTVPHLKAGAMQDLKKVMEYFDPEALVKTNITDRLFRIGSNYIQFVAMDKPEKGLGVKVDFTFINEMNKMPFDRVESLDMRTEKGLLGDWNPTGAFWAHKNGYLGVNELPSGAKATHSLRKDVRFVQWNYQQNSESVSDNKREQIESWRQENPKKYQVYGLGYMGALEGVVYPNVETIKYFPASECAFEVYGLDWGGVYKHQDPTTIVRVGLSKNGVDLYCEEVYYGWDVPETVAKIIAQRIPPASRIVCDTNNPASSQVLQLTLARLANEARADTIRTISAEKGAGSVITGVTAMQGYKRIYITESSVNWRLEAENYVYEKKNDGTEVPKDKHNHCWDAARYAALSSYFYKKYKGMQF